MTVARPLLDVLRGERRDPPPVWLMRQAGRYLPEYRALRAEKGGFLDLVYSPQAAAEVTLQPIRRFGLDGAILFSDILVVAHALGQGLSFVEGEGPRLDPPLERAQIDTLTPDLTRFDPVYETVRLVAAALPKQVTLIGFAGAPWTVASYMVAGHGSREEARLLAYTDPQAFARLIDAIVEATITYLSGQVQAGAQAIKLFDSWAGALAADEFTRWVIEPTATITAALRSRHPGVPVIGFPRGAGEKVAVYAQGTRVDALALDETIDLDWAHAALPPELPLQGNIDNLALVAGGEPLAHAVSRAVAALSRRPHVLNLGHGVVPQTPPEHVSDLITHLRGEAA